MPQREPLTRERERRQARAAEPRVASPRRREPEPRRRSGSAAIFVALAVLVVLGVAAFLAVRQCSGQGADSERTAQTPPEVVEVTEQPQAGEPAPATPAASAPVPDPASWELTLVNARHPIPDGWEVSPVAVRDGKYVDARVAEALTRMVEDCAAIYPDVYVNEAYRTHERQQEIWDQTVAQYEAQGYGLAEAEQLTGQSVAVPGTSEHEMGLAADICSAYFDETYNAPIQSWLAENGWQYGFVQRYPAGKEAVTGINNENWHFRYVGVDAAKAMHDSGQVLEEYLGLA